jgi:NAD(P)-dependent dehydrogenase (short-subunit alcohol dehydrogenase family)
MPNTWFITGTSSGFGRLLTEELLERGERVAATLRQPAALDALKTRYGERLWVEALDVTDTAAIRRVVDKAFAELGRIDVVVNNAGYGLSGAAEELSDAQIRQQIDTNVIGSIQVVRAALPGLSLYHASKWAVEGFCESLAQEVAPFDVQVTLVEPGSAATQFGGASMVHAPALEAYEATPAGALRRARAAGTFKRPGDPRKRALAMIESAAQTPAPKRLTLGSDAYQRVHAALSERVRALEAQRDTAFSTDFDPA